MAGGSWRKDRVRPRAPPRRGSRHRSPLAAVAVAFAVGFGVGNSERSRLLASAVRRAVSRWFLAEKDDAGPRGPSMMELLGRVVRERARLDRVTEEEYGDYRDLLFHDDALLDGAFVAGDASRARLRRRIQIKVLEAQIEELSSSGGGGKSAAAAAATSESSAFPKATFVWATGGDSAAAGHGNLFNQSYTSVLEDTVRGAFASVGVDFAARNRAMGGYVSAPELALCMESVYGSDVDVLAWDFGLTEGHTDDVHRAALWGERAGTHPSRPVLFLADSSAGTGRWEAFRRLEAKGVGTVLVDGAAVERVRRRAPDSSRVPNPKALPPALRHYVCDGAVEGNVPCDDPMRNFVCDAEEAGACKSNKFKTKDVCGPGGVRFQTSWHPGWKEHKLRGRLMGHFMLNMLDEALMELDGMMRPADGNTRTAGGDLQGTLNFLYSQEGADAALFRSSPPSVELWEPNGDTLLEVGPAAVFRGPAVCHTALLPSQARFDGLVTEGGAVGGNQRGGYDPGWNKALMPFPEDGRLPLAYDANDRQRCDALEVDHKDFFFVREGDGWLGTAVPTLGELRAYGGRGDGRVGADAAAASLPPRLGMIMVCLKVCPLGRCPDESVGFGYIKRNLGKLFVEIDGRPVRQIKKLEGCHFMEGERGVRWGPGDANGQYEVRFRVEDPGTNHWMKISSIVVF